MEIFKSFLESLHLALPTAVALALVMVVLFIIRLILDKKYAKISGYQFRRQIITLTILFIGVLVIIMVLPISDSTRGQLLSLIGILLSAAIALSSATLIGNIMAGIMLRAVRNFRPGDFIQVGDYFGRVSEQGLFHVEIQTEYRDLTTMPNVYLATHPVKVIRSTGTIVAADVSLGYDISRHHVNDLLLEAARDAGLEEPYVHIVHLGDFSVTYRAAGMLTDVKHLISVRSQLRKKMMDRLHGGGVEIVSPTFMNTRAINLEKSFIPPVARVIAEEDEPQPEKIVFDKADEAASLERLREMHEEANKEIEILRKQRGEGSGGLDRQQIDDRIEILETRMKRLEEIIKARGDKEKK